MFIPTIHPLVFETGLFLAFTYKAKFFLSQSAGVLSHRNLAYCPTAECKCKQAGQRWFLACASTIFMYKINIVFIYRIYALVWAQIFLIPIQPEVSIGMVGSGEWKRWFIPGPWGFMDSFLHIHDHILCCKWHWEDLAFGQTAAPQPWARCSEPALIKIFSA